jgi:hypothetical protein
MKKKILKINKSHDILLRVIREKQGILMSTQVYNPIIFVESYIRLTPKKIS